MPRRYAEARRLLEPTGRSGRRRGVRRVPARAAGTRALRPSRRPDSSGSPTGAWPGWSGRAGGWGAAWAGQDPPGPPKPGCSRSRLGW